MIDALRVLIETRLTKLQDDITFNEEVIRNKQAQLKDITEVNVKLNTERDQLIAILAEEDNGTI